MYSLLAFMSRVPRSPPVHVQNGSSAPDLFELWQLLSKLDGRLPNPNSRTLRTACPACTGRGFLGFFRKRATGPNKLSTKGRDAASKKTGGVLRARTAPKLVSVCRPSFKWPKNRHRTAKMAQGPKGNSSVQKGPGNRRPF